MAITLYSWRLKEPRTGRWRLLRWKMTEDDARQWAAAEGAELERVEGSEEVRTPVEHIAPGKIGVQQICPSSITPDDRPAAPQETGIHLPRRLSKYERVAIGLQSPLPVWRDDV